jgi:hypothetical protein
MGVTQVTSSQPPDIGWRVAAVQCKAPAGIAGKTSTRAIKSHREKRDSTSIRFEIGSERLFEPFGVQPEFLGHLGQLLGSFRIIDGTGQSLGSVGLFSVVVGLGHGGTFSGKSGPGRKGSIRPNELAARLERRLDTSR